jgi:uncharacterized UBP type Zn finger protein
MPRCHHFEHLKPVASASASYAKGCPECIALGDSWVHLRECLICGHVGCCDSSKNKHATKHFHTSTHPVMRSVEPGEQWGFCYVDELMVDMSY